MNAPAFPSYDSVQVGDTVASLALPPISRTTLALFAGASGDHNPMHIDLDVARASGLDDVFAQGMLSMAYLGRLITRWAPQAQLRQFNARFVGITRLKDEVTCTGRVTEKFEQDGARLVKLALQTVNQRGDTRMLGDAIVAL
jgi:acyl dehydratase